MDWQGFLWIFLQKEIWVTSWIAWSSRSLQKPFPMQDPVSMQDPVPTQGCCRFGADCGDCGEDGTGWCHESASNCETCTGTFDPSAAAPSCAASSLIGIASKKPVRKH